MLEAQYDKILANRTQKSSALVWLARRRKPIVHMNGHLILLFHVGEAKQSYSRSWRPSLTSWQTQKGSDAEGLVYQTHE